MNIQAVADHNYYFIDVLIKWPGSVHDVRMFSISNLFQSLRNETISQCRKVIVDGQPEIRMCILVDPVYPQLPYLTKEFANGDKDQREKVFGYRLSSVRMVIKCVFGRLKARFGSLRREIDIKLDNLSQCINSFFILHNFSEMRKEVLNSSELDKSLRLAKEFQPPIENN